MKLARVCYRDRARPARVVEGGYVLDMGGGEAREVAADEVELLPPAEPTKILAVGWNFPEHIQEMVDRMPERTLPPPDQAPIIFFKPPSSVVAHGHAIVHPREASQVDYEGELVAVIGRSLRRATSEEAREAVRGWTCGNDVTERDFQRSDKQWWRAKGFDTFAPLGPYLETTHPDPEAFIRCRVNGQLRQEGQVRDMIRDPYTLLAFMSQAMTLLPGDCIMLGTPPGVGTLAPGDEVEVAIDGVGVLRNPVVAEA
jgi:2-keto-4-pentenoate hydratase/2-oxohepta-3-ene-1,7-dioic acid hydratase in catechol pathway